MALFLASVLCITTTTITNAQTRQDYYANWMSTSLNTSQRILDVILPGSHHAGMYEAAIENNGYLASADNINNDIYSFFPNASGTLLSDWSQRQIGSIQDQLNAGSRYLDIRLEENGGTIYAHNGLLGATLTEVRTELYRFCLCFTYTDTKYTDAR